MSASDANGQDRKLPVRAERTYLPTVPEERRALLDNVMRQYQEGRSIWDIAQELDLAHTTLYRALIADRENEWRDAKVSHALANLEQAEKDLREAPDALALSRAREVVRSQQWQLERLLRRVYGSDVPADTAGRISISINVGADTTHGQAQVIDNTTD